MLKHMREFNKEIIGIVNRRDRLFKAINHAVCPKCRDNQIQIISQALLAQWRCRSCWHSWVWEPITKEKKN